MNEYVLEIKNLNKSYGKKQALTDVNLNLERGRIVGLLGPNGSGKTTMIKLINGLLNSKQWKYNRRRKQNRKGKQDCSIISS